MHMGMHMDVSRPLHTPLTQHSLHTTVACLFMLVPFKACACFLATALRMQDIADQLHGGDMDVDYDQILAKRPETSDSIFAWHQVIWHGIRRLLCGVDLHCRQKEEGWCRA